MNGFIKSDQRTESWRHKCNHTFPNFSKVTVSSNMNNFMINFLFKQIVLQNKFKKTQ